MSVGRSSKDKKKKDNKGSGSDSDSDSEGGAGGGDGGGGGGERDSRQWKSSAGVKSSAKGGGKVRRCRLITG
jgi:hypothetical protein